MSGLRAYKPSEPSGRSRVPTPAAPRIGAANDPLEHEADRMADAVLSNQALGEATASANATIQRKCAACEAEERDTIRLQRDEDEDDIMMKAADGNTSMQSGNTAQAAAGAVSDGGTSLSGDARSYFEPRFGRDLSGVRIHTHARARTAAADIGARAYTLGRDIAFAQGEYDDRTDAGRRLLAHELAHVVQQDAAPAPVIRRATYGRGAPPNYGALRITTVPRDERRRVSQAMALIDKVVNDPRGHAACHNHFAQRCPRGNAGTLSRIWRRATIWKIASPDPGALARAPVGGSSIAYTAAGYNQGASALASTLLHEAGHNCGIGGGASHWRADQIATYCMGAGSNTVTLSGGGGATAGQATGIAMLSYRRFLGALAGNRLKLSAGADLNLGGIGVELIAAAEGKPGTQRPAGELASVMAGAQLHLGGWGGHRFGGISFSIDTGFGIGRFNMRPATPASPSSNQLAGSWILQIGPRAEFTFPTSIGVVFPMSFGVAYRLVQPLNSDARAMHAIVGTVTFFN